MYLGSVPNRTIHNTLDIPLCWQLVLYRIPRTPQSSVSEYELTHALLVQAIELQALGGGRARGPRPGNPLHGIEGMDEDAVWREGDFSVSIDSQ
jgi:hypothetical protein